MSKSIIDMRESYVINEKRRFGANPYYFECEVISNKGEGLPALFTKRQIEIAINRAIKNPEDAEPTDDLKKLVIEYRKAKENE